jgi:hypothetical protein
MKPMSEPLPLNGPSLTAKERKPPVRRIPEGIRTRPIRRSAFGLAKKFVSPS